MTMDFAAAMRAATQLTRAQKLDGSHARHSKRPAVGSRKGRPSLRTNRRVEGQAIEKFMIDITPDSAQADHCDRRGELRRRPATWPGGDVAATLGRARLPSFGLDALARVRPRKALEIPDGAQFLSRSYACAAGRRSYKLYIPHRHQHGQTPIAGHAARRHAGCR